MKYRKHRLNASGEYDVIHCETDSSVVTRTGGGTVEEGLTSLETGKLDKSGGTLTGNLKFSGSCGINVRHIDGNADDFEGDLYLNYGTNATVRIGSAANEVIHTGNIGDQNVRAVGGYEAGSLWRSDGGSWNAAANLSCYGTGEYSIDCINTGSNEGDHLWHVWSGNLGESMLMCYALTGRVAVRHSKNVDAAQVCNIRASVTDIGSGSSLETGQIFLVYE